MIELSYEPAIRKYYFQASSSLGELEHFKIQGSPDITAEDPVAWDFSIEPGVLAEVLEMTGLSPRSCALR